MAIGLLGALPAAAQTVQVTASWTPPTEGSPVDHYILQISTDGGPFATVGSVTGTSYILNLKVVNTYVARVAGVDDQDRQGPWSPRIRIPTPRTSALPASRASRSSCSDCH